MTIKEQYAGVLTKDLNVDTIDEVQKLRTRCLSEQNTEYFYLSTLRLIDIYTELSLYDEGINLALQDISNIDQTIYRYIYLSYLDRLVYLYIQKRNLRLAYRYVEAKGNLIDINNRDEVNRWNLEMAYIYGEMNQKSKALTKLQAIVENLPNAEILSHALSNMTKIYIDGKMVNEAEKTLSRCLEVTHDPEGRLYCDYLYALIFILRGKTKHALELFKGIFAYGVQRQYLNMALDYLELLIKLNKTKELDDLVKQMKPLVDESTNFALKQAFYQLLIQSSLLLKPNNEISLHLSTLKEIINQEQENNETFLTESLEDEKVTLMHRELQEISKHSEHLIQLLPLALESENLRDILLEFSQKINSLIEVDEIHFALYDPILPHLGQHDILSDVSSDILSFYYKNKRLYEKKLGFDDLKDTIIEPLLTRQQEIYLDFRSYATPLKNAGTQKTYQNQDIDFLFALPFFDNNSLFFSVAYGSKYNDLGSAANRLLLRTASLILEAKIRLFLNHKRFAYQTFCLQSLKDRLGAYIIIHHANSVVLDEQMKKHFAFASVNISLAAFTQKMEEKEAKLYLEADFNKQQVLAYSLSDVEGIKYHFYEAISPYLEAEGSSLGFVSLREIGYSQEEDLQTTFTLLKEKAKSVEFKFSFIRLRAPLNMYDEIAKHFGVPIYYLGKDNYGIILEGETNRKSLERIIKGYEQRLALIRYPRDMVNIEDMINFSQIALNEKITFFTNDAYQTYLRKIEIQKLVNTSLKSRPLLWAYPLKKAKTVCGYEVSSKINGIFEKENIRLALTDEQLRAYDEAVFKEFLTLPPKNQYYLPLCLDVVKSELVLKVRSLISHLHVLIYEYSDDLFSIIEKLQMRQVRVLVHQAVLEKIAYLDWDKLALEGIIIDSGLKPERRKQLLAAAHQAGWQIYTDYQFPDYEDCLIKMATGAKVV